MRKTTRFIARGIAAAALAGGFALGPAIVAAGAMPRDPCADYRNQVRNMEILSRYHTISGDYYMSIGQSGYAFAQYDLARMYGQIGADVSRLMDVNGC